MTLFFDKPRRRVRLPHSASDYERLDSAIGAAADRVRGVMNEWFARLPAHARPAIAARFTSSDRATHLSAFFELYLHELGVRGGFDVDLDVGREDPDDRRPDLRFASDAGACFVEATVVLGDDVVAPVERARVEQLYDAIERIRNQDFFLFVEVKLVGPGTPGRKTIVDPLDRWLAGLVADEELPQTRGDRAPASQTFHRDGWIVRVSASGRQPELRGRDDLRIVASKVEGFGAGPNGVEDTFRDMDDVPMVANALRTKAGHRYETNGLPLVIAALCAGWFVEEREIAQALLGPISYRVGRWRDGAPGEYGSGGLWLGPEGWRNSRIAAVLTAIDLAPSGVAAVEPVLWTNPAAATPIGSDVFPWRRMEFSRDGRITEHAATRSAARTLRLPARWPAE